jgi:transcriptional regulator with XRE-family HTH domain
VQIGDEIRRRRRALDWTLEDLAARSGLSPRYLSSLERNERDPSLSTIEAVSRALSADPAELLGPVKGLSPASTEAAKVFATLSAAAQRVVLQLMQLLAKRRR